VPARVLAGSQVLRVLKGGIRGPGSLASLTMASSAVTRLLTGDASGYQWVAATVAAESPVPFHLASREPIMPMAAD
jgi:hypothetical protein